MNTLNERCTAPPVECCDVSFDSRSCVALNPSEMTARLAVLLFPVSFTFDKFAICPFFAPWVETFRNDLSPPSFRGFLRAQNQSAKPPPSPCSPLQGIQGDKSYFSPTTSSMCPPYPRPLLPIFTFSIFRFSERILFFLRKEW